MEKKRAKKVCVNRMPYPDKSCNERRLMISYNCGLKGHLKTEYRKPLAKCQHCRRKGHLIQYCYEKRSQEKGNSTLGTSKLAAVTLANIIIFLILGVLEVRRKDSPLYNN